VGLGTKYLGEGDPDLTVASQGMKRGDNHKPPEEKQMSIFADWP